MKFSVSQSALEKAVSVVMKGISSNSTLPILSGIYLQATEGTLELQTTNLTVSIRHKISANIEEEGKTVLSAKILSNIIKNLPDGAVFFEGEDSLITINAQKSSFHLNTLNSNDFPEFPSFSFQNSIELPSKFLSSMVNKVYKVTSKDNSRPILSGVFMVVEDNTIRLVATDSYRLAVCETTIETSSLKEKFEAIIPGVVFHDVLSLTEGNESILIGINENQIIFVLGNTTYITRKIEGNFPNYKQLLPNECNTTVTLDIEEFYASLKRVSVVALTNPSVKININSEEGNITLLTSSSEQGNASESLDLEVKGESLSIALNYHYIFDCLNALNGEKEMVFEIQDENKPGIFKTYKNFNYLYLLMPVRM